VPAEDEREESDAFKEVDDDEADEAEEEEEEDEEATKESASDG
jgi:hypothetical protein